MWLDTRKCQNPQAAPEHFSALCFVCVPFQTGSHQLPSVSTASVVTTNIIMNNEQSQGFCTWQETDLPAESGKWGRLLKTHSDWGWLWQTSASVSVLGRRSADLPRWDFLLDIPGWPQKNSHPLKQQLAASPIWWEENLYCHCSF